MTKMNEFMSMIKKYIRNLPGGENRTGVESNNGVTEVVEMFTKLTSMMVNMYSVSEPKNSVPLIGISNEECLYTILNNKNYFMFIFLLSLFNVVKYGLS